MIHILADQKADRRIVTFPFYHFIYSIDIKINLSGIFRFKCRDLQFKDYIAAKINMVKQQIDFAGLARNK